MSDEVSEKEKRRWDLLAREYPIVESKWRYLQTLRYGVFERRILVLKMGYSLGWKKCLSLGP